MAAQTAVLTGDITLPASDLFDLVTRLAAYAEMFDAIAECSPSLGEDDAGQALTIYSRWVGLSDLDDDEWLAHPLRRAFELHTKLRAVELARQAEAADANEVLTFGCGMSTLTELGWTELISRLERLCEQERSEMSEATRGAVELGRPHAS